MFVKFYSQSGEFYDDNWSPLPFFPPYAVYMFSAANMLGNYTKYLIPIYSMSERQWRQPTQAKIVAWENVRTIIIKISSYLL